MKVSFTEEQKAAIVRISFFMIYADGKIADSEMDFSLSMWSLAGITESDRDRAKTMTGRDACNIVAAMNAEQKEFVCALLGCLIVSDGEIADSEVRTWIILSELCDLPPMEINEAKKRLKDILE